LKVLLTGASGFVGSHILDSLRNHKVDTAVLLRSTSSTSFLGPHLPGMELRRGSVTDPDTLRKATAGVTHVIHCAGCTKALRVSEYYEANQQGTRNLVEALNAQRTGIERLIHISSLAVSGPATAENPAKEDTPPRPVSEYGRSKLAAEQEVRQRFQAPFTILRPPAVYGPRDRGFLSMFKAVKNHLLPWPNKVQALSLVYAKDLAETVVACLERPSAAGQTYFVASPEIVTGRSIAQQIAAQMNRWTVPFPIPTPVLWAVCLLEQIVSQLTRRARLLNLQKYAELRAAGWVCSPAKLKLETGLACETTLKQGVTETLDWYRREHWL
jgi:nucleoside-diphosphate-sugar epimerase